MQIKMEAREGHKEIVSMLVQAKGIDVNQAYKDGQTPLFIAAVKGHNEIVSMLLKVKMYRCESKTIM